VQDDVESARFLRRRISAVLPLEPLFVPIWEHNAPAFFQAASALNRGAMHPLLAFLVDQLVQHQRTSQKKLCAVAYLSLKPESACALLGLLPQDLAGFCAAEGWTLAADGFVEPKAKVQVKEEGSAVTKMQRLVGFRLEDWILTNSVVGF